MERREFLAFTEGAFVYLAFTACDRKKPPSLPGHIADCKKNGTEVEIHSNHGHRLMIPKEDLGLRIEKKYSIKGIAFHNHDVTLTPSDFDQLRNNRKIELLSTKTLFHTHQIEIGCA